jgi:ribonucleotide reductase alpha subunit
MRFNSPVWFNPGIEDRAIYRDAWRSGLKSIAVYRDGCGQSQPLSTTPADHGVAKLICPDCQSAMVPHGAGQKCVN